MPVFLQPTIWQNWKVSERTSDGITIQTGPTFDPRDLLQSPAIQTVTKGLLENGDFLLDE
jgi:hypothetical protein